MIYSLLHIGEMTFKVNTNFFYPERIVPQVPGTPYSIIDKSQRI